MTAENRLKSSTMIILYDGDCPFCASYVRFSRLREQFPDARLLNAREATEERAQVEDAGYDLNDGMAVIMDDEIFYGADAMNYLALMTTQSTLFNRMVSAIMSRKPLARMLYPVLTFGRKLTLLLLGRSQITALDRSDTSQTNPHG